MLLKIVSPEKGFRIKLSSSPASLIGAPQTDNNVTRLNGVSSYLVCLSTGYQGDDLQICIHWILILQFRIYILF